MPSTRDLAGRPSRRHFLTGVTAGAVGGLAGCLSGDDRTLSLAFVRLVNTTFEHERTIDLTLLRDGDVVDDRYEGVAPSRAPRAILKSTGPHFGILPGGTETIDQTFSGPGTDHEEWPHQLPEAHTVPLDGRRELDARYHPAEYELDLRAAPPEFDGRFDLSEQLETFEDRYRRVEDDSRVGLVIDLGTDLTRSLYPDLTFYAYETGAEQSLLESYLEAEATRQDRRESFGSQTVEDSPYT